MHDWHHRGTFWLYAVKGAVRTHETSFDGVLPILRQPESSRKSSEALSASRHKVRTTTEITRRNIQLIPPFVLSLPRPFGLSDREVCMNGIIYVIGLIVVILAILSFLGLR